MIAKTPGWYGLPKDDQRRLLETAHRAAVTKVRDNPFVMPRSYTDGAGRRRVSMGPVRW